jgi:hypothetical protein
MSQTSLSFAALDAIGVIKRELEYSYPYKSGSVTINVRGFGTETFKEVINYFMTHHCSITINTEKKQVTISGYLC